MKGQRPCQNPEDRRLLAPVGDAQALAGAMLRALARPADKAALRTKAARFSMERAVEGYEGVVKEALTGPLAKPSCWQ